MPKKPTYYNQMAKQREKTYKTLSKNALAYLVNSIAKERDYWHSEYSKLRQINDHLWRDRQEVYKQLNAIKTLKEGK